MFNLATIYAHNSPVYGMGSQNHVPLAVLLYIYAVALVFAIIVIAAEWKIFKKAGKPGWAAIVPIYNLWVLFEIVDFSGWWALFAIVPFLNIAVIIVELIAYFKLGKLFNKSNLFSVGIIFLPFIFLPILGFGNAKIKKHKQATAS